MSVARPQSRPATAADIAHAERLEVLGGEIAEKASPSAEHGAAQFAFGELLTPFNRRPGGGGGPGGWWLMTEVEVELEAHEVFLPDIAGWRRERAPARPRGRAVRLRPDWVCEIRSASTARVDSVAKLRVYHRCGVPHYWICDPDTETLLVYRWSEAGYVAVLSAQRGERVRAEPFDAIEIAVGVLFGEEPPDA
jgi:Uma2 family endonuclease